MRTVISSILTIFVLTGVLAYFVVSSSNQPVIHVAQEVTLLEPLVAGSEDDRGSPYDEYAEKIARSGEVLKEEASRDVTIIFGGDMMFDRYIRQMSAEKGYDFILEGVSGILRSADLVVANLEGPVTDNDSRSLHSEIGSYDNYIFTFDPHVLDALREDNITMLNIGNNHISNFGADGVIDTKNYIKEAGLHYFGDTGTVGEQRYFVTQVNGQQIAFVNYNAFVPNALENTLDDIAVVNQKVDHIILYTHWGEEYITHSREHEQDLAHQFIDAGADLIIGSHPHVVQESETYKDKLIYYSLGNMVFDQYFSDETRNGLLVKVILPSDATKSLRTEEWPVILNSTGQTVSL